MRVATDPIWLKETQGGLQAGRWAGSQTRQAVEDKFFDARADHWFKLDPVGIDCARSTFSSAVSSS